MLQGASEAWIFILIIIVIFSAQHASPSGRTPAPTNYPYSFNPYEQCSYCFDPYHSPINCPSWGQFYNFSYEQMYINFYSPGLDYDSNVYNLDWSNHSDFSWQAQAMGNYGFQFQELHHPKYMQFENQVLHPSSYDPLPQKSSLEDTLKEFKEITRQSTIHVLQPKSSLEDALKELMEKTRQTIQELKNVTIQAPSLELSLEDTFKTFMHSNSQTMEELKNVTMVDSSVIREIEDATMENTSAIQRLEGQLNHLVAELNRMEEEELQGQLMAEGHYMIDKDDSSNFHHEHVQATATIRSEVVFEGIVNETSLRVPFGESCDQFEFNLDLVPEQDEALLDSTLEIRPENGETTEISFPNTSFSAAEEEE
jgi:hypothetical protein